MQIAVEVAQGFRCRYSVRFQKVQVRVPVQMPGEVAEGFNADSR